jgi:ABC transport system ATP-binding/permease protein
LKVELVNVAAPSQRITLDALPAMIGRDASAEVRLQDSFVGQYQCLIDETEEGPVVWDLGTRTGTFVNGVRVRKTLLQPGDRLTVGRTDFVVHYETAPAAVPAMPPPLPTQHSVPR